MPAGSSFANINDALMLNYDEPYRGKVGWSKGVLAGLIKKQKWSGLRPVIPIRSGSSPAVSSTHAVALAAASTKYTKIEQFLPSWTKKYGIAQIEGLVIAAASDNKGAIFDKYSAQLDGIMEGIMNQFSIEVYRDGFGSVGRIASDTVLASTRLRLANPEDAVHFQRDGAYQISSANSTAVFRDAGAVGTCAGIEDLQKGWVTLTQNVNAAWPSVAVGDFIFIQGNRENSATPTPLTISGLDAWFPATVTAGVDFASGVDRSTDALLRGVVIDISTTTMNEEDAIFEATTASARYGGDLGEMMYFTNPTNFKKLMKLGQNRFRPTTVMGPYGVGFRGVKVQTDKGEIPVMPDPYCPVQRSYLLELESVKFYGCGSAEVPRFLDHDGSGQILRLNDQDAVQATAGYYGCIASNKPVVNSVVVHSTT